jgi:hypothetical protein
MAMFQPKIISERPKSEADNSKQDRSPETTIRCMIHDLDLNTYALELRFRKIDGKRGTLTVPRSSMGAPHEVFRQLLDAGAILPEDRKEAIEFVKTALLGSSPRQIATTRRAGWYRGSFVTTTETIGSESETLQFAGPEAADPSVWMWEGSFEAWRKGFRSACEASSFLTFAHCIGYAAPLLDILGEDEGAIFHFHGYSSTGKTLIARSTHSQAGRARNSDLATFGITIRGAEELCFARNDGVAVFDEEGRTNGSKEQRREQVRTIAFMVASGRGTIRSERVGRGGDLPNLTWRAFGVSSGEKPLEDSTNRRFEGEQLRHIDIQVPLPLNGGIFDRIEGRKEDIVNEAIRLAQEVETTIGGNYGLARWKYLAKLVAERPSIEARVREVVEDFIKAVGANGSSWEWRFARKFGIIATGGILAAEWGVAPFTAEHALECVTVVYRTARRSIFSVQEVTDSVVEQIRRALRDETCFPRLEKGESLPDRLRDKSWGFRRNRGEDGEIIAIDPAQFEKLAGSKPGAEAVLDRLIERRIAFKGRDGKRHVQLAVQGFEREGRPRWVCLRASAL